MSALMDPLRADCERCQGLCCIAPAHRPENGFPKQKAPNVACENLNPSDFRCTIFHDLEVSGYTACRSCECFGAGPQVTRWLVDEGPNLPEDVVESRFDDFRRLSRLRYFLARMRDRAGLSDHPLHAAIMGIVSTFDRTGNLAIQQEVQALLLSHQALVVTLLPPEMARAKSASSDGLTDP
jgi:hypothetical protein